MRLLRVAARIWSSAIDAVRARRGKAADAAARRARGTRVILSPSQQRRRQLRGKARAARAAGGRCDGRAGRAAARHAAAPRSASAAATAAMPTPPPSAAREPPIAPAAPRGRYGIKFASSQLPAAPNMRGASRAAAPARRAAGRAASGARRARVGQQIVHRIYARAPAAATGRARDAWDTSARCSRLRASSLLLPAERELAARRRRGGAGAAARLAHTRTRPPFAFTHTSRISSKRPTTLAQ